MHQNKTKKRITSVNNLFQRLGEGETPAGLQAAILSRIEMEAVKRARVRFFAMSFVSVAALISIIPAYRYASGEMVNSGFSDYFTVFFSSTETLAHWREFSLSLLESLPVVGFAAFLASVLVLLGSFRVAVKNASNLKFA